MLTQEEALTQTVKLEITLGEALTLSQLARELPIKTGLDLYSKLEKQIIPIVEVTNKKLELSKNKKEDDNKSKVKP